jgi:hypothetical protein
LSGGGRAAAWLLGIVALTHPAAGQAPGAGRTKLAHITYLTSATAYLDAGSEDGLRDAARADVVRGGATIAVLRVAFLASHRAACDIVSATTALVVGDSVRFVAAAPARDSGVVATRRTSAPPAGPGRPSRPGLRGRVGVEYFFVQQQDGTGAQVSQPALDLRLDGALPGAPQLDLAVDVRTRRTYTIQADGSAVAYGRNRVYQAAVAYTALGSLRRFTVGRQISGNLASVGLFDGVMAEQTGPTWTMGLFTGTQPEPLQLGFSGAIVEGGGYLQRHSSLGAAAPWSVTLGASGSYQDMHANREFAFLQGSYFGARVSGFLTQELDYYRPWKLLPGMKPVSLTSTFAMVRYRATATLTLDGGFDNRHNVRLYRDVVNPETAFDDTYRQGAWVGGWLELTRRYRVGMDAHSSSGGAAGHANAYTASFAASRLPGLGASLRTRVTYYTNPQNDGWLSSAAASVEPASPLRCELTGGVRAEHELQGTPTHVVVSWVGANVDVTLARAWYVMLSATRQRGGVDGNNELYGGVSFRF